MSYLYIYIILDVKNEYYEKLAINQMEHILVDVA